MGRKKLIIKRLESVSARQIKYSKRKAGILKKARELSVLCDVDVALIMFSPAGKPCSFVAHNKELLDVVDRLSKISVETREQRRGAYTIKILKKLYANTTVADLSNISLDRSDYLKVQQNYLRELEEKIAEKKKILNEWTNPENISDLNKIQVMENHLSASLESIQAKKRDFSSKRLRRQEQGVQASQGEVQPQQEGNQQQEQMDQHLEALLDIEDLLS